MMAYYSSDLTMIDPELTSHLETLENKTIEQCKLANSSILH